MGIRIHGTGSQQVPYAGKVLAKALFSNGWQVTEYSPPTTERMPLRVESHIRIAKAPLFTRDPIKTADIVLCFSGPYGEITEQGILVASEKQKLKKRKSYAVDASSISLEYGLGAFHPAPFLGAFARAWGKLPLRTIKAQVPEKEQRALDAGFKRAK